MRLGGMSGRNGQDNKFLYNGKELEDDFGLDIFHYGLRHYDPQLGRWLQVDPADEFYSPYVYCANNPIMFIDPDGAISYIIYDTIDFLGPAYTESNRLLSLYPGEVVTMVEFNTPEDLVNFVNDLPDEEIDEITMIIHGDYEGIYANRKTDEGIGGIVQDNTDRERKYWNFSVIKPKSTSIKQINLYSCEGAFSVAQTLSNKFNTKVYACDGGVSFNRWESPRFYALKSNWEKYMNDGRIRTGWKYFHPTEK